MADYYAEDATYAPVPGQWVLAGDIPGDPTAALEARESWKGKLPAGALT